MDLVISKNTDYTLVKILAERLDINNAQILKSELAAVHTKGVKNFVLDVSESNYCDSTGLSAILVANRLCKDALDTFNLTGIQGKVEQSIQISMLHTVLVITQTTDEAVAILMGKGKMFN